VIVIISCVFVVIISCTIVLSLKSKQRAKVQRAKILHNQEVIAAVHESGHAITAWYCTAVDDVHTVSIDSGIKAGNGHTRYVIWNVDSDSVKWCDIVIVLAGLAAEIKEYKTFNSAGSSSDLMRARDLAASLKNKKPPLGELDGKSPPFKKIIKNLSDTEALVLSKAYVKAKEVILNHEKEYNRLICALIAKSLMNKSELIDVLGSRNNMKRWSLIRYMFL
jgi:ATP-dependent Zn protease